MKVHSHIVSLLTNLGYSIPGKGCCYGISIRWIEACLSNETNSFDKRIEFITAEGPNIPHLVDHAKSKKGRALSERDLQSLDVESFGNSIMLYQYPYFNLNLFNRPLTSFNINELSPYASSDTILQSGGLNTIFSEFRIYSRDELQDYLDGLSNVFERIMPEDHSIGILVNSTTHAIGLHYKPAIGWKLMDVNSYPAKSFAVDDSLEVAKVLFHRIKKTKSAFRDLNFSVITKGNCPYNGLLQSELKHIKENHIIGEEHAKRIVDDGVNLAYLSAKYGDVRLLQVLTKYPITLNAKKPDGFSLAHVAAQNGHQDVLELLREQGLDIEAPDMYGYTPAHIAAFQGHGGVINLLVKHQVDFNIKSHSGKTPASIATLFGHHYVIKELLKALRVDLNQTNSSGESLAYIAALHGYVEIIAELRTNQSVNFNKAAKNGATPLYRAAERGHLQVIRELALCGVDVNKKSQFNVSPLMIATINGHIDVVSLLIQLGANSQGTVSWTPSFIRMFIEEYAPSKMARANEFIHNNSLSGETPISLSALDVATIIENEGITRLLHKESLMKIENLYKHIDKLRAYGERLSRINAPKTKQEGLRAIALANEFKELTLRYVVALNEPTRRDQLPKIRAEFKTRLAEGKQEMKAHRKIWKRILANIAIAATGIGLFALAGKLIATRSAFFAQTRCLKELRRIGKALEEFEPSNRGYGNRVAPL